MLESTPAAAFIGFLLRERATAIGNECQKKAEFT